MPQKRKDLNITGSNLWYLVGLITSDGNLSKDGRHIDITSSDQYHLLQLRDTLRLSNKVARKYGAYKTQLAYRVQISNKNLYEFLTSIGLTPCKSLTIKNLEIDEGYFNDFLRGLIDGDGCIRRWFHPTNGNQQWSLRVYSGSRVFLEWLKNMAEKLYKIKGRVHQNNKTVYALKYGKMAARELLRRCYYGGAFALDRKAKLAQSCVNSYRGWDKSKTVFS